MDELTWGLYTVILAENNCDERLNLACIVYGPNGYCRAAVGTGSIKRACVAFGWASEDWIADAVEEYIATVFDAGETFEERKAFVEKRIDRGYPGSIVKYRTPYGTAIEGRPPDFDNALAIISDYYLGDSAWTEWTR